MELGVSPKEDVGCGRCKAALLLKLAGTKEVNATRSSADLGAAAASVGGGGAFAAEDVISKLSIGAEVATDKDPVS